MATPVLLPEQATSVAPTKPAPPSTRRRLALQAVLLVTTFATTIMVGMRYMENFRHGRFPLATEADVFPYQWVFTHLSRWQDGLPFSLTLLGILLAHEFGHYFACRAFGVKATLPYLIPAPSLSGTAGAIIRLRTRVKTRAALITIGASGPIAGFVVAIVTTCLGLAWSTPVAIQPERLVTLNKPLAFYLLRPMVAHVTHLDLSGPLVWHPVLVASWIGLLVTSLNLVPAGQLDGGHILYSLSPRIHLAATRAAIASFLLMGIASWLGWVLWMGLLLLPGMRHPNVTDRTPLTGRLRILAPICLAILILTATPEPFQQANLLHTLHWLRR